MKIWLIHVGELLPVDKNFRLFRYGVLAEMLAEQGHVVTRWAPTFVHAHKRQRCEQDKTVHLSERYRLELLYVRGYARNVSLARVLFHCQLAKAFEKRVREETPPDLILAGIPTIGMCLVALRYAQKYKIPFVVDVRDLWPDVYLTVLPPPLRSMARWALLPAYRQNRQLFQGATAIFGVSESYLNWGLAFAGRPLLESDAVFPLAYSAPTVTAEEIAAETRKLLHLRVDPKKIICCFFGQFEASYDLQTVIDAARVLEDLGYHQVQFVLCGDGTKMPILRKQAAGLTNVIFPGWISASAIQALMAMSKIGLAAYSSGALQSLPNKPIEYLSGGLPIVSSLPGELEKMLAAERCGITYPAKGRSQLVNAIRFLADNPDELENMSRKAIKVFESRFSSEHVYPAMIDQLARIARRFKRNS